MISTDTIYRGFLWALAFFAGVTAIGHAYDLTFIKWTGFYLAFSTGCLAILADACEKAPELDEEDEYTLTDTTFSEYLRVTEGV